MVAAAPKFTVKCRAPKRGKIKIKIFNMIGNSLKNLAAGVARKGMKAAGDGRGVCGCFNSPVTIIPIEANRAVKMIGGSIIQGLEHGGEKGGMVDGGFA